MHTRNSLSLLVVVFILDNMIMKSFIASESGLAYESRRVNEDQCWRSLTSDEL